MFAPILLVCILGTDTCELMGRIDKKVYPTYEVCMETAAKDAKKLFEYFYAKGVNTQIGFKCEEDKNSI